MKKPIKIKNFISEQDSKIFIDYMDNNEAWFESWADGTIFNMYTGKDNLYNFGTDFNDQKYDSVRNLIIKYGEKIEKSIQENFPVDYPVYLTQFWMTKRKPGTFGRFNNDSDYGKNNKIKFSGIIYLKTL